MLHFQGTNAKFNEMPLKQFYLGCLAHASYLIWDHDSRLAAVVDPQRDVEQYLEETRRLGCRISHVILTHFHADFVSGHLELERSVGAKICLGSKAKADYPFLALKEGESISLGRLRIEVIETPGHTPEGICLLVYEPGASSPQAILTGDTLFIGDVGRPDLMASQGCSAEDLAGLLYDSLHEKILKLPDETLVYPAHGAGSLCGKNLSTDTVSNLGVQRRYNYALQPMSRGDFIRLVTADQPEVPLYFSRAAALNAAARPTLDETLGRSLKPLSLGEVLAAAGAVFLDVRDPIDFEAAHLKGSLNVGLGGKFATWAGTVLEKGKPVILIAEPGRQEEAAVRLGRVGIENVLGFLQGGMSAAQARPDVLDRTPRLTALALWEQLRGKNPPLVLDVRNDNERRAGSIQGSLHIPLSKLASRIGEVPAGGPLVVHCASGYRSAIAASLLESAGRRDVGDLVGGFSAWEAEKLPTVSG